MSEKYYCPFISLDGEYTSNRCMVSQCMFWDGQADDDKPKGKCVLVRAAFALSTHER